MICVNLICISLAFLHNDSLWELEAWLCTSGCAIHDSLLQEECVGFNADLGSTSVISPSVVFHFDSRLTRNKDECWREFVF